MPRKLKSAVRWKSTEPGNNPVCLVGAGFQFAVLDRCLPKTETIISQTVRDLPSRFPALKLVRPLLMNVKLNYVWANLHRISEYGSLLTPKILTAYQTRFRGSPMGYLVEHLKRQPASSSPTWLLWILLGVELKKMLAFQYAQKNIKRKHSVPSGLVKFLAETKKKRVTWISLNYDLCLETVLKEHLGDGKWRYGFENFLEGFDKVPSGVEGHVIVKPHGSLNIWFKTKWETRSGSGKRDLHELYFVDPKKLLKTCAWADVGCVNGNDPAEELRPWIIGYLPDAMKDEINSPGNFADTAHDLSKWNVTYAALALQKASSLCILAYSMPEEDHWIWERLRALPKKTFPIYVASAGDTKRIVDSLCGYGFHASKLTENGFI